MLGVRHQPFKSCNQKFHEFFHISEDTSGHVGTARNVAGLYVVDVVEFPEWCSGPGRVAKVEVVSSNLISRSKWR